MRHVLAEEAIDCDYREPGHLHLALGEEAVHVFAHSCLALQQAGVPAVLLDRVQLQEHIHTPLGPQYGGPFCQALPHFACSAIWR